MKGSNTHKSAALYARHTKVICDVGVCDLGRFCETQSMTMDRALQKAAQLHLRPRSQSGSTDNRSGVSPRLDNRGRLIIISEITPRRHNRDPEYCLLSEERNPFLNNPQ
jgi:hypothetical protein